MKGCSLGTHSTFKQGWTALLKHLLKSIVNKEIIIIIIKRKNFLKLQKHIEYVKKWTVPIALTMLVAALIKSGQTKASTFVIWNFKQAKIVF